MILATAGAALWRSPVGTGQEGGAPGTLPALGTGGPELRLMGAVTRGGAPGEAWGYEELPSRTPPPVIDGKRLERGPSADETRPQLAFLRVTDGTPWQVRHFPQDRDGRPYRGMTPNPRSARLTARGGGVLVGRDGSASSGDQLTVLVREPGKTFRIPPPPPAGVLQPGEALAAEGGSGRVAVGAHDADGHTVALFGVIGPDVEDAVVRYDGGRPEDERWTREPIDVPPELRAGRFRIVALDARDGANAWLAASAPGRGVVLFRRTEDGDGAPRWTEAGLDREAFSGDGAGAAVLEGSADALTAAPGGVWIDGELGAGPDGEERDFTLFRAADAAQTTSWCDAGAPLCDHPLGVRFSRQRGYTSTAFGGAGFGGRVISNPLAPGGDDTTNRGTHLRLDGTTFTRVPGIGGNFRATSAFASPDDGWLEGPIQVKPGLSRPDPLTRWPVALRAPLEAVAAAPGTRPGATDAGALAVGQDGAVVRHVPGSGWQREFLLSSAGFVSRPLLRGVAWPEAQRAHAVGDVGAMWLWRGDTGLWERDPAAPVGFEGNLQAVAFDPSDGSRGFAAGKEGALLRYDKTWTQEALPAGFERANLWALAFAGRQAIAVAEQGVLVNDGGGWRVDDGVQRLLDELPSTEPPLLLTAAGLPDGGAVVAGRDIVLVRDRAGAPWRFSHQPLSGLTAIAAAAVRDGGEVRAIVSTVARLRYPLADIPPEEDPESPAPIIPPYPLPPEGYLLRETGEGWRDETRSALTGTAVDRPLKADPVHAMLLDGDGEGWAVGGWSGFADSGQRGTSNRSTRGRNDRARVQTAAVFRYRPGGGAAGAPNAGGAPVEFAPGPARFTLAGHAQCEERCADLSRQEIGPDRSLVSAVDRARRLASAPNGPRMLLYTGGRLRPEAAAGGPGEAEMRRYATLLDGAGFPVFPAASAGDTAGGSAGAFSAAFGSFPAPFGGGSAPEGVTPVGGTSGSGAARTHYAFDSAGAGGTVRVIVIDNSAGSLAEADPHQVPPEPGGQAAWLRETLAEAKARGIPSVVMGSRDLNTRFTPRLNAASDGDEVAQMLVEGGASAYVFERPEENRSYPIPAGAPETIPSFGTGTLGYRSAIANSQGGDPDALFGDPGLLVLELDASKRDPQTNRAPASVRLVPLIDDLTLQAVDGTLLRRSRPALFQALGRRPVAGDRWGPVSAGGNPTPAGGDPYVALPPAQCLVATCSTRVTPEYRFTSSDPSIGDFVRQDPSSTNLRKPLLGEDDRVISDAASGLFCAFNPGTTTVTVRSGGLSYSEKVVVQGGSVQRPCGTRPTAAKEARRVAAAPAAAPPPPPAPAPAPAASPPPPAPPPPPPAPAPPPAVVVPAQRPSPAKPKPQPRAPQPIDPFLTPAIASTGAVPTSPPPPAGASARPSPPGGATVRVFEEKREEEAAPEQSSAAARYRADDHMPAAPWLVGGLLLAALAGAAIRPGPRSRTRRQDLATAAVHDPEWAPPRRRH